ncbi:3-hydroxyacyl-CoA dehydrogenase [Geomicrobium halophilum]|uniref:3-hydroxyacyl-CoA dehydrogenase n=1 Tax=Geomicrobium halophilum TaxID=549000 RepID=A0A841PQR1_9BACL|nr:3-hydroxyacyl-CoA dehydrogenase [Geomicrobium halophilum]
MGFFYRRRTIDEDHRYRKSIRHGIDVGYYVSEQRYKETGDPADKPSPVIEEKVKQGHLARKTGKGWYEYTT